MPRARLLPSRAAKRSKFQAEALTVNAFRSFLEQLGTRFTGQTMPDNALRNAAQKAWYGDVW
jgi:hypothetical protein